MKKVIITLLVLVLASCASQREELTDRLTYGVADPTEIIKVGEKSQKELLAEAKERQGINADKRFNTVIYNLSPNILVPRFPEFWRENFIDNETVFRSW
jgi:hypothetical protein